MITSGSSLFGPASPDNVKTLALARV